MPKETVEDIVETGGILSIILMIALLVFGLLWWLGHRLETRHNQTKRSESYWDQPGANDGWDDSDSGGDGGD